MYPLMRLNIAMESGMISMFAPVIDMLIYADLLEWRCIYEHTHTHMCVCVYVLMYFGLVSLYLYLRLL